MRLRDRWMAARVGWSSGEVAPWFAYPADSAPIDPRLLRNRSRRPLRPNPTNYGIKPDRLPWTAVATAIVGIASVLLVLATLIANKDDNRKQQDLALKAQTADRFTAAIAQLAQDDPNDMSKLSIRLGGVFSLDHVMSDAPSYEPAVIQVLTTFVGNHSPTVKPDVNYHSPIDVCGAVRVLAYRPDPNSYSINLSANLLVLDNITLNGAHLAHASFIGANLNSANFQRADLRFDRFSSASLNATGFVGADLSEAYLDSSNATSVVLTNAQLRATTMEHSMLRYAQASGARFESARLGWADMNYATLKGAKFNKADLEHADLRTASLARADFTGANLFLTDFRGADLTYATGLTKQQLALARTDAATKLPATLK